MGSSSTASMVTGTLIIKFPTDTPIHILAYFDVQIHIILRTRAAVIELEFRPDGEYLASASDDKCLLIWNIRYGKIMKSYNSCDTSIYNLSWDKEGNLITAGSDYGTLCVVDVTF